MAWSWQERLNMLAMHLFVWKAHQHGACGFGLTIGPLLWAGTHDCVVVCCITSRTARFLFTELVGMLFSFWCLSLRVGLSRPSHSCHQFALRALQFLHWTILPSVCPQLVTCLRPHGLFRLLSLLPILRSLHFVVSCIGWLICAKVTRGKSEACVRNFHSCVP